MNATAQTSTPRERMNPNDEGAIVRLASAVLASRRWFVGLPAALAILTGVVVLSLPLTYTTRLSFRPVGTGANLGQLAGLASQFGVALPGGDASTSADFYADLVRTPEMLRALALKQYVVDTGTDTLRGTFIDLYEIRESTEGRTLFEAIRTLNEEILNVQAKATTSVVSISIETDWPSLSRQMGEELLRLIDSFNVASRQFQADAEYRFMEQRLDTAMLELTRAENRLQSFLEKNREFRGDPELVFQYDRLSRDVTTRQTVYTTLLQAVEQMRIEAVRNTPSISVTERPLQPLRPNRRGLVMKILISLVVGLLLSIALVFVKEVARSAAALDPVASSELESEWRATRADVRRVATRFLGVVGLRPRGPNA